MSIIVDCVSAMVLRFRISNSHIYLNSGAICAAIFTNRFRCGVSSKFGVGLRFRKIVIDDKI